jgi:hypothetical protein
MVCGTEINATGASLAAAAAYCRPTCNRPRTTSVSRTVRRMDRPVTVEPATRSSNRTGAATRSRIPAAFAATKNSRSKAKRRSRNAGRSRPSTSRRKILQPVWVSRTPMKNNSVTNVEYISDTIFRNPDAPLVDNA